MSLRTDIAQLRAALTNLQHKIFPPKGISGEWLKLDETGKCRGPAPGESITPEQHELFLLVCEMYQATIPQPGGYVPNNLFPGK